ncbi:hypothetical protein I553_8600 [Mycobacterium xenopi 4042]|uniref:Uncharacterized protein n=1 Tax=Mycobacterium xenopi 4042 TaxID=1299334 RepID=X8CJJ7_MYCXE|nr:hypothetical protein I553_8600 [Mycobacterium xenopi 4042]
MVRRAVRRRHHRTSPTPGRCPRVVRACAAGLGRRWAGSTATAEAPPPAPLRLALLTLAVA